MTKAAEIRHSSFVIPFVIRHSCFVHFHERSSDPRFAAGDGLRIRGPVSPPCNTPGTSWPSNRSTVESLDEQFSYFRPASQLSPLNRLAAQQPVELAPGLFDLLRLAMTLYEETEGAYDVTSAPLWEAGDLPGGAAKSLRLPNWPTPDRMSAGIWSSWIPRGGLSTFESRACGSISAASAQDPC